MDWDNLKIFLALAREGTTRGACDKLGVASTTVMRRIDAFEDQMDVRLFDRMGGGYKLTAAGQELIKKAVLIEEQVLEIERNLSGLDRKTEGIIRVSVASGLLDYLLMPFFKTLSQTYPDTYLDIDVSNRFVDIARLESDVAIRLTNDPSSHLPESLVGRKHMDIDKAIYCAKDYNIKDKSNINWIGWHKQVDFSQWVAVSPFPKAPVKWTLNDMGSIASAVQGAAGISYLPCFIGDQLSGVKRVKAEAPSFGFECWVVTHKDLHKAARIKLFLKELTAYLNDYKKSCG